MAEVRQSSSTSLSLLERVRLHDQQAWQRFARIYGPIVYGWSVSGGLQPSDAADVTQDVFTAVAAKLGSFERDAAPGSFRAWLYTVTRNKVRDHFRALQSEPQALGGETAQWALHQTPELPASLDNSSAGTTADLAHRVLALIQNEFEARTWQAFWQVTVQGRAAADVAGDLGLSLASVYQAKCRVLKYLRRELAGLTP